VHVHTSLMKTVVVYARVVLENLVLLVDLVTLEKERTESSIVVAVNLAGSE